MFSRLKPRGSRRLLQESFNVALLEAVMENASWFRNQEIISSPFNERGLRYFPVILAPRRIAVAAVSTRFGTA